LGEGSGKKREEIREVNTIRDLTESIRGGGEVFVPFLSHSV
jgi:hypothetical protein